ncbi:MAG: SGNH/GDSL hydrolase family protein [Armatimonadota bacterium]
MRFLLPLLLTALATTAFAQNAPTPAASAKEQPAMNVRMILPPEIPAVPGREVNIYFDNIILSPVPWQTYLQVDVDCLRGRQEEERFTRTPTTDPSDIGIVQLTIKFSDMTGKVVAEGKTNLHIYPPDAGKGKAASLLIVGDSLTNASVYPAELLALCTGDTNPQFTEIGTNITNAATPLMRHEGYGGWQAATFVNMWGPADWNDKHQRTRSPFLFEKDGKPVLDFQKYCDAQNGGKGPDIITIMLGCNDNFGAKDETLEASIDSFEKNMDILIAEFHRVRPDTKIGIITLLPPAGTQDAFGNNYGCGQTRWQYRKNQHRVVERTYAKWSGKEAQNIFIIPGLVNLDTMHNYPTATAPANARADGAPIVRLANGVHPAPSGYRQLADTLYCWLKGQMEK